MLQGLREERTSTNNNKVEVGARRDQCEKILHCWCSDCSDRCGSGSRISAIVTRMQQRQRRNVFMGKSIQVTTATQFKRECIVLRFKIGFTRRVWPEAKVTPKELSLLPVQGKLIGRTNCPNLSESFVPHTQTHHLFNQYYLAHFGIIFSNKKNSNGGQSF